MCSGARFLSRSKTGRYSGGLRLILKRAPLSGKTVLISHRSHCTGGPWQAIIACSWTTYALCEEARSICLKIVELTTIAPALAALLDLAGEDTLILKTSEGREFVPAEVDDFDTEIALVRQNKELMA